MNISLKVEGQSIQVDEILQLASDTISQVDCSVQLSTEWSDFQLVKCVWENQRVPDKYVSTLTNGTTTVPWEVLAEQGSVRVNLIGYDVSGTTVTERQTTFKIQCLNVKQKVNVTGSNTANPTAQEWQQQLASHVADSTKHVTAQERSAWNAKADASNVYTKAQADGKFALITAIADMATKTWVTAKGYATEAWVNAKNYATQSWVEAKGYLTEHQSLTNYFTKSETNSAINSHHDSTKVDKVTGKGLSANDYTTAEKTKLSGIETGAQVNVIASDAPSDSKQYARKNGAWSEVEASGGSSVWGQITGTLADQTDLAEALSGKAPTDHNHDSRYYTESETDALLDTKADTEDVPTKTSELTNDSGFITQHQSLSAYRTSADQDVIDSGKVDKVEGKGLSTNDYTTAEKTKLSGIEANADVTDNLNVKDALTDSLASAWADADKKACCGTIGAVYVGQYELIEEITLTEDVDGITRTHDTEGNPYNFKAIICKLEAPSFGGAFPGAYGLNINDLRVGYVPTHASAKCYARMIAFIEGGKLIPLPSVSSFASENNANTFAPMPPAGVGETTNAITKFSLTKHESGSVVYPSGTKITIHAIRN